MYVLSMCKVHIICIFGGDVMKNLKSLSMASTTNFGMLVGSAHANPEFSCRWGKK